MNEPELLRRDALTGRLIGLSVSASADLPRLGLDEYHCRLVIAEVGRAIMLAGGTVVYGGNLQPGSYTDILVEEARRFGGSRPALRLCIPESEFRKVDVERLREIDNMLADGGRLTLISAEGIEVPLEQALNGEWRGTEAESLTAMRFYAASTTDARVLVGGKLAQYAGAEPGIIEEARLTLHHGRQLLAVGGYGGAAAAVAQRLHPELFEDWAPEGFPAHLEDEKVAASLEAFDELTSSLEALPLDEELVRILTVSHRPGDIATATVRLLAQALSRAGA